MSIKCVSQYYRFCKAIENWLPGSKLNELSEECEKENIEKCIRNIETHKLTITLENRKNVEIVALTRYGYFIVSGKPYVWPWREVYCPNWIYKNDDSVEVWSAPVEKPWELYKGRLKLSVYKDTLCVEGNYEKGYRSLKQCLVDYKLGELDSYFDESFDHDEYAKLLNGKWEDSKDSLKDHPFLPHLNTPKLKSIFLSLMIRNFFDTNTKPCNTNDISMKRVVGVDWLIGHICGRIEDSKACTYMVRRIFSQGQLVNISSHFETLSHLTRVIRGKPVYGNFERRELHSSHFGVYCPYRASEGEGIGLKVDLVTGIEITHYTKNPLESPKSIVNGVIIDDSDIQTISIHSKDWQWVDGCRVIPNKRNAIGYVAKQIVFKRHMPPVRAMYATTHLRQAVKLSYPQKPIVYPESADEQIINGCNAIVAVCGYHGWNIEDAIVCSRSFIERGGLQSIHQEHITLKKYAKESWSSSLPAVGYELKHMDICVSKKNQKGIIRNIRGKVGMVKDSYRTQNDGTTIIHLESIHTVEQGDKLSTRSGQKGIVGHIANDTDMPHTCDGIVPDIIINPAHLPSRMTVSQMLESFFGKEAIHDGKRTSDSVNKDSIQDNSGKEDFICGRTGKKLCNPLFVGTVYYMALHHKVHKKCRSRGNGINSELTGQPAKGGAQNGGLRIGEMERDSIRSRDAYEVLKERMRDTSDLTTVVVCKSCGWLEPNVECCPDKDWKKIPMSKTSRLVLCEMYGLGIFPRLHLK